MSHEESEAEIIDDIRAIRSKVEDIEKEQGGTWITDKRIPVALILAVAAQTFGAIWWASAISKAVEQNHTDLREMSVLLSEHKGGGPHPEAQVQLAELRIMVGALTQSINRLVDRYDARERANAGRNNNSNGE